MEKNSDSEVMAEMESAVVSPPPNTRSRTLASSATDEISKASPGLTPSSMCPVKAHSPSSSKKKSKRRKAKRSQRIRFGWDPNELETSIISSSGQMIHAQLKLLNIQTSCLITIVYREHTFVNRRSLWADLIRLSSCELPWIVAGDFNAIRDPDDRVGSTTPWILAFDEFGDCLNQAGLEDLRYVGCRYTWTYSSGDNRKLRKIDRVLINDLWNQLFSFSEATFLAPGISDHSPMVIKIFPPLSSNKPFKFFNFWATHPKFLDLVTQVWDTHIVGTPMYMICCKLRVLKAKLKHLNRSSFFAISTRTEQARSDLYAIQVALERHPFDQSLLDREVEYIRSFSALRLQEESFFSQKSRIRWLKEGDMNTKFFHHFVNKRRLQNRILSVSADDGVLLTDPQVVRNHIVGHFQELLNGNPTSIQPSVCEIRDFIGRVLDENQRNRLAQSVSDEEIQSTLFSLARGKALGPDGYNVDFFKTSWEIIGPSILMAVRDFFESGCMLKELNNTILTLVPKSPNASAMTDFRPIACCNTLYKCISKILARRIAHVLPTLISPSQTAFVKGRRISDNIMIAQELFADFHHEAYLPKCAIKVDFQKAFDTVDWEFIEKTLKAFKFPDFFVKLVMACVSTTKFSFSINGELHGFFASCRGPDLGMGGAKVAWNAVCLPKEEGGLGIRRLVEYNRAMTLKHIWLLFTDKESMWCKMDTFNLLKNIKLLDCIQTYILLLDMEENSGFASFRPSTISVEDW
ncbi:uncharacterized protein LOC130137005 [Syzygium oleosum]|uniref:uncharacterized protein LOC130137005 n=1 Tax=Syzygium oleosum TaxID=219896 RepID=UPI0024BB138C|nr:uncharacterized protein LOC130137005 [Syzygium oleosum]